MDWKQLTPYISLAIAAGVLIWRQSRAQGSRLRPAVMWIAPVLIAAALAVLLAGAPPPLTLPVLAGFPAALGAGLAFGYLMARHMALNVDPQSGAVSGKATPIGLIVLVALLIARTALRSVTGGDPSAHAGQLTGAALLWTDLGILFSAGLVWGRVVTLTLRVRPLVAAHRANKAVS